MDDTSSSQFDCQVHQLIDIAKQQGLCSGTLRGSGGRSAFKVLRSLHKDTLITAEWLDHRANIKCIDPPNPWKEVTYDDCVEWTFCPTKQVISVTMWDGDLVEGFPTDRRCRWQFSIERNQHVFDALVRPVILRRLKLLAISMHEKEQIRLKELEVNKIMSSLFSHLV